MMIRIVRAFMNGEIKIVKVATEKGAKVSN